MANVIESALSIWILDADYVCQNMKLSYYTQKFDRRHKRQLMHMILALFPGTCLNFHHLQYRRAGQGAYNMLMMCVSMLKSNEALLVFTYALHTHAHAGSFVGCKK